MGASNWFASLTTNARNLVDCFFGFRISHGGWRAHVCISDAASPLEAISQAKATLTQFREGVAGPLREGVFYGVKIHFPKPDGGEGPHIWLRVSQLFEDFYFCSPIELPSDFVGLRMGESKLATEDEIEDWMMLGNGTLYGGFSLRAIREQLPASKHADFDLHMGFVRYADEIAE